MNKKMNSFLSAESTGSRPSAKDKDQDSNLPTIESQEEDKFEGDQEFLTQPGYSTFKTK